MTDLQFQILNAMADDAEDVEQIYLTRESLGAGSAQPQQPLRDIIDGVDLLLKEGYIKVEFRNDPNLPLKVPEGLLHHYWFSPTAEGKQAWNAYQSPPTLT